MPSKKKGNIKNRIGITANKPGNIRNNTGNLRKAILFLVLSGAFIVRIIGIGDHAYVFDEAIYVKIVKDLAVNGYDWQSMRMLGTAHPPIYFILLSFLYKYFYFSSDEIFFRSITILTAVIVTYVIYKLGSEYSVFTGITAAAFFAFNPYFIAYSRFATLDMLTVLFITIAIYFYSKYISTEKIYFLMLAGASFGLATFTKVYAGIFLVVTIIHLLIKSRQPVRIIQFVIPSIIIILLISLLLGQGIFFPWTIFKTSYGWSVGQQIAFNWALITVSNHIGFASFVLSMIGLGILTDMAFHKKHQLSSFYVLAFLLNIIIFTSYSGTHFARYFLILAPSLCIFFGYSVEKIIEIIKSQKRNLALVFLSLLVIGISSDYRSITNGSIYSATLIDDWWHIDSFRDIGKNISKNDTPYYISDNKDLSRGGEFFITNAHYPVLEAYSGMKGAYYMGYSRDSLNLYWLGYKGSALGTYPLDYQDEQNASYIVIVDAYTDLDPRYVLYTSDLSFSWYMDDFLREYLVFYDFKGKFTSNDNISSYVFKRNTNNTMARMDKPTIFIGQKADNWTFSNNGWINGIAWSGARNGTRSINSTGFAGIVLNIPDVNHNSTLEVTIQDTGTDSLIFKVGKMNISIGEIKLNDTKKVFQSRFIISEKIYSDADPSRAGIQQQILILKNGNSSDVPVSKVSIYPLFP